MIFPPTAELMPQSLERATPEERTVAKTTAVLRRTAGSKMRAKTLDRRILGRLMAACAMRVWRTVGPGRMKMEATAALSTLAVQAATP